MLNVVIRCQSKVYDGRTYVLIKDNVVQLDVTMDIPILMDVKYGSDDLPQT